MITLLLNIDFEDVKDLFYREAKTIVVVDIWFNSLNIMKSLSVMQMTTDSIFTPNKQYPKRRRQTNRVYSLLETDCRNS